MPLIDVLLPEYDRETGVTRCLLERVPESQHHWHPDETSMSLGRLAFHLADVPCWIDLVMTHDAYDLDTAVPESVAMTSTEDLLVRFDGNVSSARETLLGAVDSTLTSPWALQRGQHEVFRVPRIGALRHFAFNPLVHHRGQLSVYLRMLSVPVPAIYGPSIDERAGPT